MRKVLTLVCLLAVAHHVAAQCNVPSYSQKLVPQCAPNDVYIKWPNYENQATYYTCNGAYNPVLTSCPSGQVFTYVLQECTNCGQYIPPVQCNQLKTQNPPNCVPIDNAGTPTVPGPSGPTLPTPHYPETEPTKTTKTTTTKTTKSTTTKTTKTTKPTVPTPEIPTPSTPGIDISPPPSPITTNPNVPMPPTPAPTPPSVEVTPPSIPAAPTN